MREGRVFCSFVGADVKRAQSAKFTGRSADLHSQSEDVGCMRCWSHEQKKPDMDSILRVRISYTSYREEKKDVVVDLRDILAGIAG